MRILYSIPLLTILLWVIGCTTDNDEIRTQETIVHLPGQNTPLFAELSSDNMTIWVKSEDQSGQSSIYRVVLTANLELADSELELPTGTSVVNGLTRFIDGLAMCGGIRYGSSLRPRVAFTDQTGQTYYSQEYSCYGSENVYRDIAVHPDGSIVAVGSTSCTASSGGSNACILHYKFPFDLRLDLDFNTDPFDGANAVSISAGGRIAIVGDIRPNEAGDQDILYLETKPNGGILSRWIGGPQVEKGNDIAFINENDVVLCGESQSEDAAGQLYAVRMDQEANITWAKHFGESGRHESANGVLVSKQDRLVFTGASTSTTGDLQLYLLETDMNGSAIRQRHFGDTNDQTGIIILEAVNSYIIIGTSGTGVDNDLYVVLTAK